MQFDLDASIYLIILALTTIFIATNCKILMNETFAERLRRLRKQKRLSQADVANLMEVHYAQVSRYERGETKPNTQAATKLAQALEVTVDYLMNGTEDDMMKQAGLDREIIARFKQVQHLDSEEKKTVLSLLDAFIAKKRIQDILR